jgi:simple sugar transport system permease protein
MIAVPQTHPRLSTIASGATAQAAAWVAAGLLGIFVVLPAAGIDVNATLVRMTPLIFTGLAVALPARAGLVNIGGEGQFVTGMILAAGAALAFGDNLPAEVLIPFLAITGAAGGAAWAAIAAVLKIFVNVHEALSTLLLNFVAPLILQFVVFGPWKDPATYSNLPQTAELDSSAHLPTYGTTQLHLGIVIAVALAAVVWLALEFTRWGFRARVVGGNPEAARRAGISVRRVMLVALLLGGAAAGIGGMIEVTGVEGRLRPGIGVGFGYIGFLASWLVGHRPLAVVGSAFLLAAISVSGDSLQINAGLPSTSVYVLMALVILLALGVRRRPGRAGGR